MSAKLPVFDIQTLRQNPGGSAARHAAETLRDICHHQGFCYLVGHGLDIAARRVFNVADQFFALPSPDRRSIDIANTPHFRGYTILGTERTKGAQDWRDQLDFADDQSAPTLGPNDPAWLNLRGPNQWPEALPAMKPVIDDWLLQMHEIGLMMIRALSRGLGLGASYFDPYFDPQGDARLKLIRYRVPEHGGTDQGVGWHHDTGFLTFIIQDEIGGLQVDIDGQIIDATPMKGAMIMNLGEMLQMATDGYLRATPHRVKSPPPGRERKSMAYFFNPRLECEFKPIDLPNELARDAPGGQNTDPNDPVFSVVGENILKTRLRAHPDVARRHYS
ncbi:MAG TPA: isopenicillin N synthase family oxygenase [Hellea balneolensis]|uniref:2-oxoglutarate-dependent ethylene/succinate-forming enzyme n=1 Tax=Hellea balneolensis TaxID=287478 RepID=A0A7C5QP50_9PROT|nr:isopenicillin N synthase family oxygenase [Hellea balneolensis]